MFTIAASSQPSTGHSLPFQHYQAPFTSPPRYRSFAPLTPSPLRESRNALNLPVSETSPFPSSSFSVMSDSENVDQTTPTSQASKAGSIFSSFLPSSATKSSSDDTSSPKESIFSQKARSQSPQQLLNRATSAQATARRSLFFERGRKSRDDKKLDARSDQYLRMEFVRERREWEERMKRAADTVAPQATTPDFEINLAEEEEDMDMESEQMELPPPIEEEEEQEILDLGSDIDWPIWSGAEQQQHQPMDQLQPRGYQTDTDEDDYDQLFMDVLSQNDTWAPAPTATTTITAISSTANDDSSMQRTDPWPQSSGGNGDVEMS